MIESGRRTMVSRGSAMSTYFANFGKQESFEHDGTKNSTEKAASSSLKIGKPETITVEWDPAEKAAVMHLSNRARGEAAAYFYSSNLLS